MSECGSDTLPGIPARQAAATGAKLGDLPGGGCVDNPQDAVGQTNRGAPQEQALPARSPDGVDLTLISWMLSLSPGERLAVLQNTVRALRRLRDAAAGR